MITDYIERMKTVSEESESRFINDILRDELIINTSYPIVIMDINFKILFINQSLLRLFQVPFEKTFMKNYLAVASYDEEHFYDIKRVFDEIAVSKKHRLVDLEKYPSYIHIFPILSNKTNEVEYFQVIHVVGEKHIEMIKEHEVNFNNDYVLFAHQLSVLLATKDEYTAHHSSNVSKYVAILGKEIGIEKSELKLLEAAGSLHDIGKINIPNRILNKNGKLTPEEREIVEKHTIYTSKILSGLKIHELSEHGKISEVGLYHHEWYDGTGYPYGLVGKEIPITARLITLVDSFDAMTTDRPYRKGMSVDDTIQEILRHSGTHFDPYLVNKFVNMDLEHEMTKISKFDRSYTDVYSIPGDKIELLKENVKEMFENVDPYEVLNNLCDNGIYGIIVAEYSKQRYLPNGFCSKILYENNYFDDLIEGEFFESDFDMCYKKSVNRKCKFCPVSKCVVNNKISPELVKLENEKGEVKYLNTVFYPLYNKDENRTVIVGIVRDNTIEQSHSISTTKEFFTVTRCLTDLFAERDERFRRISNNMEMLATWIADKVQISGFEIELLVKAISICDLGIIPLIDSNEYSFESIEELRHNTDHIKVIDELMMSIETFKDIKDIVLYHHALYNDTDTLLVRDQVPIQSYIIRLTDFILTDVVANEDIEETLKFVEKMSGKLFSPTVCKEVLKPDNKKELMCILNTVL